MGKKRKRYSAAFKAKVALEAARGEKTLSQIASEFGVHGNQVATWRRQLLDRAAELFDSGGASESDEADLKARELELYEQIGRLKMEVEWLKKKSSQFH